MALGTVTAKELYRRMQVEDVFVLDIRTLQAHLDWRIQGGAHVTNLNMPYADFEEQKADLSKLPQDREIVIVCYRGRSAQIVGNTLDQQGYQVTCLEGGMNGWSQFYQPVTVHRDDRLKLIQLNRLGKGCLSYLVVSEGEAMVVDPGRHVDEYIELATQENAVVRHVMDTHLHADHISGGRELADRTGAAYYISAQEMQGAYRPHEPLEQHDRIQFGAVDVQVIPLATPGHTPGSVSFLVNDQWLLSGDTIFVGGLGRPDLGGKAREWAQMLYDTVFQGVAALRDDILVLPTHYAGRDEINEHGYVGARLGEIRRNNDVMRVTDREQFTQLVTGNAGSATPPNYQEIVQINRGTAPVTVERACELESGPNRCAAKHSSV